MYCDVKGSNPFRGNGSSVGRVHNEMARPVKPVVQFHTNFFYARETSQAAALARIFGDCRKGI